MARARQVGGTLLKVLLRVGNGLIVNARSNFAHDVVQEQRGFQIANFLVHVVAHIFAKGGDGVSTSVVGDGDRGFFGHVGW